ncbi:MAG: cysteine desulfurase [Anaerolineales bacterium]|nr:cysteine desulfurase [Anaerolineales bacterium]
MNRSAPRLIYCDYAATTPIASEVLAEMLPYLQEGYGNASSLHAAGRRAAVALQKARRDLAALLSAAPGEILFTSGGTESDNAALRGIASARRAQTGANHIITSAVEHKAVLATAGELRDHYGFELTVLPVDHTGLVRVNDVAAVIGDGSDVAVISIMVANNEVGTIQPISAIGALCRRAGVPFHTDAVQAAGKLPLNVATLGVDAMSLSGHKIYGPKGVGLLYLRRGVPFWPQITGGSQEGSRRGGTENVPGIVGFARAMALSEAQREGEMVRQQQLRDRLIGGVREGNEAVQLTGDAVQRLPNHASFVVDGLDAEGMLIALDLAGIAASSGSACSSGSQQPSHVLRAMGYSPELSASAIRFSLGRDTTPHEIDIVIDQFLQILARMRQDA